MPSSRDIGQSDPDETWKVHHAEGGVSAVRQTCPSRDQGPMIERDNYHLVKSFLTYQSEVLLKDPETLKHFSRFLKHLLRWADDTPFDAAIEIRPVFPLYLVSLHRPSLSPQSVRRACLYARMFFH